MSLRVLSSYQESTPSREIELNRIEGRVFNQECSVEFSTLGTKCDSNPISFSVYRETSGLWIICHQNLGRKCILSAFMWFPPSASTTSDCCCYCLFAIHKDFSLIRNSFVCKLSGKTIKHVKHKQTIVMVMFLQHHYLPSIWWLSSSSCLSG